MAARLASRLPLKLAVLRAPQGEEDKTPGQGSGDLPRH